MSVRFAAIAILSVWQQVKATPSFTETYTTNAICERNNCINPIFPGLEDLHQLDETRWVCSSLGSVSSVLGFCQGAINYDPALPLPAGRESVGSLVRKQDNAAATAFFYHLTGLGYEAWDFRDPRESNNDCVKSVWKMVCYTYFPRSPVGCLEGSQGTYLRPCKSSCQNYIQACGVECCDESVQCVFSHTKQLSLTTSFTQTGYINHDGPSSLCTGAAHRMQSPSSLVFAILLIPLMWPWMSVLEVIPQAFSRLGSKGMLALMMLMFIAISLQGCDAEVPEHHVGNWRGEPDYLIAHQYIPPGGSSFDALINSCSLDNLSPTLQCSGRGTCKIWSNSDLSNRLAFCNCEVGWADPECKTPRKSQTVAFLLALFTGWLGFDQFYLGFVSYGCLKLVSLGGFGIWWIIDIIRIGSSPVHTTTYRVGADLAHWAYVLITVSFAMSLGFIVVYFTTMRHQREKRREAILLQLQEEDRSADEIPKYSNLYESNIKPPSRLLPGEPAKLFRQATGPAYGTVAK